MRSWTPAGSPGPVRRPSSTASGGRSRACPDHQQLVRRRLGAPHLARATQELANGGVRGRHRELGELLRLVEFLKLNPDRKVLIEGYTDSIGSSEYNLQLSLLRAESAQSFLVGNGLPVDRITAIGYGETRPEAPNESATGRQQNRRVEVVILDAGE